jgi:integrase
MHLTKTAVDKLIPPTDSNQAFYRDDQLKGFAVRITANGIKSFIIEKLIGGKVRRLTIGRYGALTVEQARKEAQKLLGKIATGVDLIAEKQTAKVQGVTLLEVFNDYLNIRKELKPKSVYEYKNIMKRAFAHWQHKPLLTITKDKIAKCHAQLGETSGTAYANSAMRTLRALFNFAAGQYEDAYGRSLITENPVRRLSQTRAWYRIEKRRTYVKTYDFAAWYQSVIALSNETFRDYLLLILFTGLRREEAAQLTWQQIDLQTKTLTIPDPKNHDPHVLPLSDYLYKLLKSRSQTVISQYVFPGTGKKGHIVEPRRQTAKVKESSSVQFTIHDLRRTFITVAESLDIPAYALKRLLNHKMTNDVTAGYIVTDVERLRKPMQQITDYLMQHMGIVKTDVEQPLNTETLSNQGASLNDHSTFART